MGTVSWLQTFSKKHVSQGMFLPCKKDQKGGSLLYTLQLPQLPQLP